MSLLMVGGVVILLVVMLFNLAKSGQLWRWLQTSKSSAEHGFVKVIDGASDVEMTREFDKNWVASGEEY